MTTYFKSQSGFTLIEVLVSISILMIIGAFLFDSLNFTVHTNATSKEMTIASNLAHEELERIKSLPWDQITSSDQSPVNGYTGYERKVDVINHSTNPPLKRVTVTVYWQNWDIPVTTLLAQYGR